MRFLKLTLAYDGTGYAGWQVQPEKPTVQQALQKAASEVTGQPVQAVASGRTDSGVHALGQVVSIATNCQLDSNVLQRALNANLPQDIAVLEVADAPDGFHAIRDALGKHYRYEIHNSRVRDVFRRHYVWQVVDDLDLPAMQRAAELLVGRHDFASFQASGSERASTIRDVRRLSIIGTDGQGRGPEPNRDITIDIEADGFLYNMVRNIVGTLIEVGRGAQSYKWVGEVLAALDRRQAGPTAPPQGLYLVHVDYGW